MKAEEVAALGSNKLQVNVHVFVYSRELKVAKENLVNPVHKVLGYVP